MILKQMLGFEAFIYYSRFSAPPKAFDLIPTDTRPLNEPR